MWVAVGVLGLLLIYQLFFRYEYYHYGGNIARIDRLTGTLCAVPCLTTPAPQVATASPKPTIEEANKIIVTKKYQEEVKALNDERLQEAIAIAKRAPDIPQHDATYEWQNDDAGWASKEDLALLKENTFPYTGDPQTDATNVFIVCLCDSNHSGWRWEINDSLRRVRFINDNAVLKDKYGL